jgi:hypothetical protein
MGADSEDWTLVLDLDSSSLSKTCIGRVQAGQAGLSQAIICIASIGFANHCL